MITIQQALDTAICHDKMAKIDAEVLLTFVLKKSRSFLFAFAETELSEQQWQQFKQLIAQRQQGMPVAYLTGQREFWSLPLKVTQDTLIPRPETELLVELTLTKLSTLKNAQILELGTGSGAIALALAKERPDWNIIACDKSQTALAVAQQNAIDLGLGRVKFIHSDWFSNIPDEIKFQAIVANPPYIAPQDPHVQQGDLRFEPLAALVSENNGLAALTEIIKESLARLEKNGLLLVEHGYQQKEAVLNLFSNYGYQHILSWQDWQGNDRVCSGRNNR